jgi:hypothetical protein
MKGKAHPTVQWDSKYGRYRTEILGETIGNENPRPVPRDLRLAYCTTPTAGHSGIRIGGSFLSHCAVQYLFLVLPPAFSALLANGYKVLLMGAIGTGYVQCRYRYGTRRKLCCTVWQY